MHALIYIQFKTTFINPRWIAVYANYTKEEEEEEEMVEPLVV